jgi:hypothetical protein
LAPGDPVLLTPPPPINEQSLRGGGDSLLAVWRAHPRLWLWDAQHEIQPVPDYFPGTDVGQCISLADDSFKPEGVLDPRGVHQIRWGSGLAWRCGFLLVPTALLENVQRLNALCFSRI